MNYMYFKSILIADIQKQTARFLTFDQGLNVITSSDNHVGKSSVLKCLYYTLGAEVKFDARWDKSSKLTMVTIIVNDTEYQIARYLNRFAIFKEASLILLSESVTKDLSPKLSEIFDFTVYLAEKTGNKKVVQAAPAFTFMPYYIDQDKGWSELYNSFENIDQFSKPERAKSLYFHLGLYNKTRIENQTLKDYYKDKICELQQSEKELQITINALTNEINNIVPADTQENLEQFLIEPKKEIEEIVAKIGKTRNNIQKLQTALQQHESQLDTILRYQKSRSSDNDNIKAVHICPQCGYEFDDNLYELVRSSYNQSNSEYLTTQIKFIINNIKDELSTQEQIYVELLNQLKEKETVYDESQNAYNAYLRHMGLRETLQKYQLELEENRSNQSDFELKIKEINKELKKIPDKSDIEQIYIDHVKHNIISLKAWTQEYDGKIKLLKPINAQGSLMPKIILSQYTGLFQTMHDIQSNVIRFPFIVDSPREKESSESSSKDILTMIMNINCLPQIILSTVDFDQFGIFYNYDVNKIYLVDQFHVLNENEFNKNRSTINGLYNLLQNM